MASVEHKKRKREEYEMQLFGFHSRAVFACLRNLVYERIQSRVRRLSESLESKYKPDSEGTLVLRRETKQLAKTYIQASEPHLKSIENVVNKFIAVPSNVLLKVDEAQAKQYTEKEFQELQYKLEESQKRIKRAMTLNSVLKQELQDLEQFKSCEEATGLNRLCNVIELGAINTEVNCKMSKVIHDYQDLEKYVNQLAPLKEMDRYKSKIKNLELKEIDLDHI